MVFKNEYTTIEYIRNIYIYKESHGRLIAHVTTSPRQLLVYGATVHTNHVIRATVQPILIEDGSTCPEQLLGNGATVQTSHLEVTLQNWGHSLSPDETWRMLEATGCAHAQPSILYPPSYTLVCSPPHVPTLLHPPSISLSPCVHPPHVSTLPMCPPSNTLPVMCIQVTCVTS